MGVAKIFLRKLPGAIVVALALILSLNALSYLNFDTQYGFLRLKQDAIATGWYLPFYYSHVLVASLILMIGLFQLTPSIRKRFPKWHRYAGYFYIFGILFFAAPGGLVMSLFIGRGPVVLVSFILQSALWFAFTAVGFHCIRKGDFVHHQQWMWRSYALTFAAITLRLYIFIFSFRYDLHQPAAYATLAWLSWVPNWLLVEALIRRKASSVL